jgi:hypothetical protein
MPTWLQYLVGAAAVVNCAIGAAYFIDKYFRTRKAVERDSQVSQLKFGLESGSWKVNERVELERRLSLIESDVRMLKELNDLREKIMANVLHSPHRPELDRLLEKLNRGEQLTDAELMFAKDYLWQIVSATEGVSKGEQAIAGDLYAVLTVKYKQLQRAAGH